MKPSVLIAGLAVLAGVFPLYAADTGSAQLSPARRPVSTITPIFSQLVVHTLPENFVPAFEASRDGSYLREAVLKGETVDDWSQMITLTGMKDRAKSPVPQMALKAVLNMTILYKRSCPASFASEAITDFFKVDGFDAFAVVVACGKSAMTKGSTSESALILAIIGQNDIYTLQWAERGSPSETPPPLDIALWQKRLIKLAPLHLCPVVPGEPAPYPSCSQR